MVAGINIDAPRPVPPTNDMVVIGYGASELEPILEARLEADGRSIRPDTRPEAGFFYRSDHVSFAKVGIPMLYTKNGIDVKDGGEAVGRAFDAAYTAERYHKPMDQYQDTWVLDGMTEDIAVLYDVGLAVIRDDDWPTWYEGNEFKATRDASLAAGGGQ